MTAWSTKRRFIYGGSTIIVATLIFGGIFWKIIYKAPTCSDGVKNGDEKGIDCGGSCKNLCTSDTLTPVVLWSKIFHISGKVYTAVAYVQNPNINSKNPRADYEFSIYDSNNKLILVKDGETSIPKNKKFAVFETGLILQTVPKSADFRLTTFSPWQKDTSEEPDVSVDYGTLTSTSTSPRLSGTIHNNSLQNIPEMEITAFILDGKQNVIGASRTFIDNLASNSSRTSYLLGKNLFLVPLVS